MLHVSILPIKIETHSICLFQVPTYGGRFEETLRGVVDYTDIIIGQ